MAKKRAKSGRRHKLLFFRHSMDRIWRAILIFDLVLWAAFWFAIYIPAFMPPRDRTLFLAAEILLILGIIFYLIRNTAYIQAREDHMRLAVPLYRLNIPYGFVQSLRTNEFSQIYTLSELNWSNKRFFRPYFGATMVTLILRQFPKAPGTLQIFLPKYLFLPKDVGFLFLINDWMGFSTEFDSRMNIYRTAKGGAKPFIEETKDGDLYNLFGE